MHGSKYVTNTLTLERYWLQSFSVHLDDDDQETPWLQNPWRKDAIAFIKKDELGQIVSRHNLSE